MVCRGKDPSLRPIWMGRDRINGSELGRGDWAEAAHSAPETSMETIAHFIAGQRTEGSSGRVSQVFNPATGEAQRQVPLASPGEVDNAVAAAKAAFPAWSATPPLQIGRASCRERV